MARRTTDPGPARATDDPGAEASAVLLIGDPRLRARADEVADFEDPGLRQDARTLVATLEAFRERHGFGRAIAAPQIGVGRRLVALNLGKGPFCVYNPVVSWRSSETFTLWDDCMSFPDLLVKLSRHCSISLDYQDERGAAQQWDGLDMARSELLLHELDHLDGVLAVDRALDANSLVHRAVFEANRAAFRVQVDYVIGGEKAR